MQTFIYKKYVPTKTIIGGIFQYYLGFWLYNIES